MLTAAQRWLPSLHLVLNAALVASYGLARRYFAQHGHTRHSHVIYSTDQLLAFEKQAAGMLVVVLAVQVVRKKSSTALASDFLLYAHAVAAALCYYMDKRICVVYGVLFALLWLLLPPPLHRGSTNVGTLTPHTLREELKQHERALLVMTYAAWSQGCVAFDATFAQLSLKHRGRTGLLFRKLDVSRWPTASEEYKVSLVSVNGELPTLLLFERGKVTQRLLQPYGSALKGGLSVSDVERHFRLSRF